MLITIQSIIAPSSAPLKSCTGFSHDVHLTWLISRAIQKLTTRQKILSLSCGTSTTLPRQNLLESIAKFKHDADCKRFNFKVGDFVWAVLTKDRFPIGEYNKLSARKIGPIDFIEKINSNAYCLKLPSHIRTAHVFNVKHLLPFHGDSSS